MKNFFLTFFLAGLFVPPCFGGSDNPFAKIIDNFEDLSKWKIFSQGLQYKTQPGFVNNCIAFSYDLDGRDYVVVSKDIAFQLPENFKMAFYIKGTGKANNLEFKLMDDIGNVYLKKWDNLQAGESWQKIVFSKKDVKFAWGPDSKRKLSSVKKMELAISKGEGGTGTLLMDEITLIPDSTRVVVTASSFDGDDLKPDNAYDGDYKTRWSSKFSDPQWIKIDFGTVKECVGIVLKWEVAYGKNYDVLLSKDDISWKPVSSVRNADGGIDESDFERIPARYLKIAGKQRGTYFGYSLYEIEMKTAEQPWGENNAPDLFCKKEWYFRTDAGGKGEKEKWFSDINDLKEWKRINTGLDWERQGYRNYDGSAWYKDIFYIPESWKDADPLLLLNDVYNDYTLYINGQLATVEGTEKKKVRIKKYLKFNSTNLIALKVFNSSGKGGIVGSVLLTRDLQSLKNKLSHLQNQSYEQYYQFLAETEHEGFFPYWLKREQGFWTVVGADNDFKESLLYEDGAIEPYKSFSLFPFLFLDGTLIARSDVNVTQTLEKNYLPIPSVKWERKGVSMNVTVFSGGNSGHSVTYAKYSVKNASKRNIEGAFYLAIRPFELNPPWQWGGFNKISKIELKKNSVHVNDFKIFSFTPLSGFGVSGYKQGDIIQYIKNNRLPDKSIIDDRDGFAAGAMGYSFKLKPGEEKKVFIGIPLYKDKEPALTAVDEPSVEKSFTEMINKSIEYWENKLNKIEFIIPDSDIMETFKANLAYIFINNDKPAIQPGSRAYEASWIRDGAVTSSTLLKLGYQKEVRDYLEWYSKSIYPDGRVPAIIIIGRNEVNPVKEYDSQGEFIYALLQYYYFSKDKNFLLTQEANMTKVLKYLENLRSQRVSQKYQNGPFYGILPNSVSHEGYYPEPGNHSYWDDFWALKGWKDARTIFKVLNHTGLIEWTTSEEKNLRESLLQSISSVIKQKKLNYIPGCAELGDFDSPSTAISVMVCDESKGLPQYEFRNTFNKYYDEVLRRQVPGWTGSFSPYEFRNVQTFILMNEKQKAWELFKFLLTYRRPLAWKQWSEAVYSPERTDGYIGDMPHTWVSSGFISAVRSLFVYEKENEGDLILSAGIPDRWLENGKEVGIKNAPTYWGMINYVVQKKDENLILKIWGGAQVPGRIIFKSPLKKPIKQVMVNNSKYEHFTQSEVIIERLPAEVKIEY